MNGSAMQATRTPKWVKVIAHRIQHPSGWGLWLPLILFSSIPGMVLSFKSLQEPWTLFRVARSTLSISAGHIVDYVTAAAAYRIEHLGGDFITIGLITSSKWPGEWIALVPIGSLLLSCLYYAVAVKLTRSVWTAAAITIFSSWYYPRLFSQYGVQLYAWTHVLLLTFILLFLRWLERNDLVTTVLIAFVFLGTFLCYQTTPLWIIIALSVAALSGILSRDDEPAANRKPRWLLVLFCLVIYLAFDTVLYSNYIPSVVANQTLDALFVNFFNKILSPLLRSPSRLLDPFETTVFNPPLATMTTMIALILLTWPVGMWLVRRIREAFRSRALRDLMRSKDDVFIWSILTIALGHFVGYAFYGAISLRVIPIAFPLILPLVMQNLGWGWKRETWFVVALAGIAIVGFLSFEAALKPDVEMSDAGLIPRLFEDGREILADPNTYGVLQVSAASEGKVFDLAWPSSDRLLELVDHSEGIDSSYDYVVLDRSGKPIITTNWMFLEPWVGLQSQVASHPEMDKLYESEFMSVLKAMEVPLPTYGADSLKSMNVESSILEQGLGLAKASLILFFLPGALMIWGLKDHLGHEGQFSPDAVGFSIGISLSLVILVGYILNVFSLGFEWIGIICLFVPLIFLAYKLIRGMFSWRELRAGLRGLLPLVFIVTIWALLAATVAQSRSTQSGSGVEFFLTQDAGQPETVIVNIHNPTRVSETYNLFTVFPGDHIELLEAVQVQGGMVWKHAFEIPPAPGEVLFLLEKQGGLFRELHLSIG